MQKGLALIVNKNFTNYKEIFEKKTHSDRISSCEIKLQEKTLLQIIQVYVPTCDHYDETVKFYIDITF